jgi:hypothetical protein
MDTSTGEKEFTQFLTQTPQQFEEAMEDGEKGIIINDQDIIKPEDVFGRGKRCRTIINVYMYALITQVDVNLTSKLLRVQEGHIFAYILRTRLTILINMTMRWIPLLVRKSLLSF